jgi:hypothetical protein
MADIILVAATLAFIAICVGYVNWCDRIIGRDDFGSEPPDGAGVRPALTTSGAAAETQVPA